ncbi:DNA-binding MurR/RpiR family transcriptional regulator [Microbacterium resistens]|uniref:DNA-binding MurR/RpiR family transcriptional regulator n=1 Tax=Microbacterium resistens TaxID=156977 RepID=A0ABU1SCK9_9MICO|nr:MurR/RpiR family transcriptional regulator [Microbacterium resistens]MDR6867343.1 DNA-binding MurR/RpiR family transcriptional regulator [Microbacterium resistens]
MDVDVIAAVRGALPRLSAAEARVAEKVLGDPTLVVDLAITDLARLCGTSLSTVARFAQTVGFSGYRELRVAFARAAAVAQVEQGRFGLDDTVIDLGDDIATVAAKIGAHEVGAIEQTVLAIDFPVLDRVAAAIAAAPRVQLLGHGASSLTAQDMQFKLSRIGFAAAHSGDPHVAVAAAALLAPGDVAVAISHSGETAETRRGAEVARAAGALTVALTNAPNSPLDRICEVVLHTHAKEAPLRMAAMSSRIAQLALLDVLFVRVVQHRGESVNEPLRATRRAVIGR